MKKTPKTQIEIDPNQLLGLKSGETRSAKVGAKKRPAKFVSKNGAKVGGKVTS